MLLFYAVVSLGRGAQEYSYKHYEIKDGLVGNNVYQVAEDKEGFIWFATETGVSRFDGTSFKNFTTAEGLPDNEILRLFVDSKNRVWMMPFKNAVCYYYNGKIYNAENDSTIRKLKITDRLLGMNEDGEGNLFFFQILAASVLKPDNHVINRSDFATYSFFFGSGNDNRKVPYVFMESIPDKTKLYKIKAGKDTIILEKVNDSIRFSGNRWTYSYINSNLFVYLNNYENRSDYEHLVFNNYRKQHIDTITLPSKFNLLSFVNDSILFFNTGHGAIEYNYQTGVYHERFLDKENISCTLDDKGKNLWFTTLGNGVFRLHSRVNKNIVFNEKGEEASVEAVLVTGSKIFVGTDNAKVFEMVKSGTNISRYRELSADADIDKVIKFIQYKGGFYLLCESRFYKFDPVSGKLQSLEIFEDLAINFTMKDVSFDDKSTLFFATHMGVMSYAPGIKKSEYGYLERVTSICVVDSGYYIGSLSGLKFVNRQKQILDLGSRFPVLKSRITKLLFYKNKIWIGTNDKGVVCYDGEKIDKNISVQNGLSGNLIRAMFPDNNDIWVGTDRGLNKIHITDTSFIVTQQYTVSDGLLSNMINAVFVQNDTVYVGTPKGLSFFDDREMQNSSICNMRILDIIVSGKSIPYDSTKLLLKNRDNNIRFDFVALSYKSEANIVYYYKLSEIDSEWKTTKENFLQYPTLPSGVYELQLYAVNKFGIKSETVNINFEIEKKLIETTWFLAFLGLILIGISIFLAHLRIRRIKSLQREKSGNAEKIAELEQQALKAQMNPHFIFNCLNSIQQYVIDKDVQGANKFISGFSKLIRQTLDNSGKKTVTVAEEESFLRSYLELEKSRFEEKFDYSINIDRKIRKDEDCLPPMLLQPYIENCIRHGIMHKRNGNGIIEVLFNLSEGNLVCSVTDNGIGRLAADEYRGMQHINYQSKGTDLTRQRILMINKTSHADIILKTEDLVDANNESCGTRVTVVIPLQSID